MLRPLLALCLALPLFGASALVQSKGGTASTRCDTNGGVATTLTCTFSSTPTVGNTVIVSATTFNTTMTASDNQGGANTYTPVAHTQEVNLTHEYLFSAPVTAASGTFTVTVNIAGGSSYILMRIYEFSGLDNAALIDQTFTANNNGASANPVPLGPITTTSANEMIFMTVGSQSNAAWVNNGGAWTQGENHPNAGTTTVSAWDQWRRVTSIQSTYTANMEFGSGLTGTAGVLATFKESGGAAPAAARRRVIN